MANVLKMAIVEAIRRLQALQWSARRIASELGIDRGTVGRYLKLAAAEAKPAISPAGSEEEDQAARAALPPAGAHGEAGPQKASFRPGRRSHCEPYREVILAKLDQGLSAQRICQDLAEQGFAGSYDSVKRFVHEAQRKVSRDGHVEVAKAYYTDSAMPSSWN